MTTKRKQIIWGLILIFLLSPSLLFAELPKINYDRYEKELILLLNSGLTQCETSDIKYILWTEDSSDLPVLKEIVRNNSEVWQKDVVSDFTGKRIYKYSLTKQVDKEGEKLIPKQLDDFEQQLEGTRILLYFHQQINETIDSKEYFCINGINKTQMTETAKLLSITAYSSNISKIVQSAKFDTNVQVITSNQSIKGKTLLAIPALLEDF